VPREQKMLKRHLPRVIYHQVYLYTKRNTFRREILRFRFTRMTWRGSSSLSNAAAGATTFEIHTYHTVEHDPFIKSQLASRN